MYDKSTDEKKMNFSKDKTAASPTDEKLRFTIKIYKDVKISIYKPLISLKLAQFLWFGAASFMIGFLIVLLKQRGVSLSQLSWMNVIAPISQLTGTAISGIVADKIGKSKPVLLTNIILVTILTTGILVMPSMNNTQCEKNNLNIFCSSLTYREEENVKNCSSHIDNCFIRCLENKNGICSETNSSCHDETEPHYLEDFSDSLFPNLTIEYNDSCYLVTQMTKSFVYSWCSKDQNHTCQLFCSEQILSSCENKSRTILLVGYIILYVLQITAFSNVFRCFDVTTMAIIKEHNTDFGHERFFGMLGNLLISPFAGLIADATTSPGAERNYSAAFYLFFSLILIVIFVVYKMPAGTAPPSKKMGRKSIELLKNIDIISFMLIVLVLGTAWNFTKIFVFWYLEDLGASSLLIGLIPSVSAFYGLPFLFTGKWWVEKIGSIHLIIISFIGYVFMCIGFSFLVNPWYALFLESFTGLTYCLLWVAVITHSHELAPEGMKATVVALAGAIHFSIGKATNGLVGGLVMNSYGGKVAFRVIATICFITAILYSLYLRIRHSYVTKQHKLTDKSSGKSKNEKNLVGVFVIQNNT